MLTLVLNNISELQCDVIRNLFHHYDWDFDNHAEIVSSSTVPNAVHGSNRDESLDNKSADHDNAGEGTSRQDTCYITEQSSEKATGGEQDTNFSVTEDTGETSNNGTDNQNETAEPQREVPAEPDRNNECPFCFLTPCVTETPPHWVGPGAAPHDRNAALRKIRYKKFWSLLNRLGAWIDPRYKSKKEHQFGRNRQGCVITMREIMPECVLRLVRSRYPNIPGRPYMGHLWE